jgi:hypothetical protein
MQLLCKLCNKELLQLSCFYICNNKCPYVRGLHDQPGHCWENIEYNQLKLSFYTEVRKLVIRDISTDNWNTIQVLPYEELTKNNAHFYLNRLKNYSTFI